MHQLSIFDPRLGVLQLTATDVLFVGPVKPAKSPVVAAAERRAGAGWNAATRAWVRRVVGIRGEREKARARQEPMPYVDFVTEQRTALRTGADAELVARLRPDPPESVTERRREQALIDQILAADPTRIELSRSTSKSPVVLAAERRAREAEATKAYW